MSLPRYVLELVAYARRATEALERIADATEKLGRIAAGLEDVAAEIHETRRKL